jgi:hypothetical protein
MSVSTPPSSTSKHQDLSEELKGLKETITFQSSSIRDLLQAIETLKKQNIQMKSDLEKTVPIASTSTGSPEMDPSIRNLFSTPMSTKLSTPVYVHSTPNTTCKPVEPERFNGESANYEIWIYKLELFFNFNNISDDKQKAMYAISLLSGPAAILCRDLNVKSYKDVRTVLDAYFKPVNDNLIARMELDKLTQNGDVRSHTLKFNGLVIRVGGMTEDEKKHRFIESLNPSLKKEVKIRQPKSLLEAISIATVAETVITEPTQTQIHLEKVWVNRNQEREKLLKEGRCFYCKEQGHVNKDCPKKKNRNQQQPYKQGKD